MALWSKAIGAHGYTVTVTERKGSRFLSLYFWDAERKNMRFRSLGHADRERAEREAMDHALLLRDARQADATGILTVGALFARFEEQVVAHEVPRQKKEDERRLDLWRTFLGPLRDVTTIDRQVLDDFCRLRRRGELVIPNRNFRANPTERTVGADLEFLRRVFNWAATVQGPDRRPLCTLQPFKGYDIPDTPNPKRPIATYDRWLAIRAVADEIDGQGLFGGFWDILDAIGWRVSAICQIRVGEVDLTPRADAPFGRIKKRGKVDKEGMDMWVPLSKPLQSALRRLLKARAALGPMPPTAPLFPSPGADDTLSKPWLRGHAKDLLELAETAAKLTPIEGGDFHPYRRAWATSRKHLPIGDVAATGGWRSTETLQRCYQQVDAATMLTVVSEPRRLRDARPAGRKVIPARSGMKHSKNHSSATRKVANGSR